VYLLHYDTFYIKLKKLNKVKLGFLSEHHHVEQVITLLVVILVAIEMAIIIIIVVKSVRTKPVVPWIPAVISKIPVLWVSVHEPASIETAHRVHSKRMMIEVTGEGSIGANVIVITNGVPPSH